MNATSQAEQTTDGWRDRIKAVMSNHSRLTRFGVLDRIRRMMHPPANPEDIQVARDAEFDLKRAELLSDDGVREFLLARRYLKQFAHRKSINRRAHSYRLKHSAEAEGGAYVSNGALIAAAIDLGFAVKQIDQGPNCWLSLGKRLNEAAR